MIVVLRILHSSFHDVQLHIVDALLSAGPESILPIVVADSGLVASLRPGMTVGEMSPP